MKQHFRGLLLDAGFVFWGKGTDFAKDPNLIYWKEDYTKEMNKFLELVEDHYEKGYSQGAGSFKEMNEFLGLIQEHYKKRSIL